MTLPSIIAILLAPTFITDAGLAVSDSGAVELKESFCPDCLVDSAMIRADLGFEATAAGYNAPDRLFSLPGGNLLLSWMLTPVSPERPKGCFLTTYHPDGTLSDGLFAGECDDRTFDMDSLTVSYNSIPPAFEVMPDGKPEITIFRTLRIHRGTDDLLAGSFHITIGIDSEGNFHSEGIRPVPDDLDQHFDPAVAADLRRRLRSCLGRIRPYSRPVEAYDILTAASDPDMILYYFARQPLLTARTGQRHKAVLRTLSTCDGDALQTVIDALPDPEERSEITKILTETPLNTE